MHIKKVLNTYNYKFHFLTIMNQYCIAKILDVNFVCANISDLLNYINIGIDIDEKAYISITNTESLYYASRCAFHYDYVNNAKFSCCDGIGVVFAGKIMGYNIPRHHGPDLMLKCCEYGIEKNWKHFFYGGKEGIPELLSEKLTKQFPGLITAGTYSPPFRALTAEEDEEIIKRIKETKPDIVWVGLGLLKQERWIAEHLHKVNAPWMVGVGAAFDFHAGTIKRAPKVFRNLGLEWLYRLAFEPRMFIRNVRSFLVLVHVAKEAIKNKLKIGQ
jgi:N-acetylglucosaminyldiphosphoundecaprenol N-acetyl-beta-D-mannosaminyltransferase